MEWILLLLLSSKILLLIFYFSGKIEAKSLSCAVKNLSRTTGNQGKG
jgi:hypothetical protein